MYYRLNISKSKSISISISKYSIYSLLIIRIQYLYLDVCDVLVVDLLRWGLTFHSKSKTWIEALEFCFSHNTMMLHVTNETLGRYVDELLSAQVPLVKSVWIGLERPIFNCSAPWVWKGGLQVQYQCWGHKIPLTTTAARSFMRIQSNWSDAHCFEHLPFICQHTLVWFWRGLYILQSNKYEYAYGFWYLN